MNGLREIDSLFITDANDEALRHASVLHDAERLVILTDPGRPISERGLSYLRPFERLKELRLIGPGFTDETVARMLVARPPLETVVLYKSGASRLTMEAIAEVSSVRQLAVLSGSVSDDDFRALAPLPQLEQIVVTGMGDHGAEWLAQCPNVRLAWILESPITNVGLRRLCECPRLTHLYLHEAQLTDSDLVELLIHSELHDLEIVECPLLTAEGIAQWPELPHLHVLSVSSQLLTPDSVARMKAMPNLGTVIVHGTIADADLQEEIDAHWSLRFAPSWVSLRDLCQELLFH